VIPIQTFTISRDDAIYEAFPDVALTASGRLVCVFAEMTHHGDRSYTRVMLADSTDRGRTWTVKRPLSEPLHKREATDPSWNCPRIVALGAGRLVALCDRRGRTVLWFSEDEGQTWTSPCDTPVEGIVPDRLVELRHGPRTGRWLLAAHQRQRDETPERWQQRAWYSDDRGATWRGPVTIAESSELMLCEGSIVELPGGELVCFMRENSGVGIDCHKCISTDGGESWEGPIPFPLPACHRPVAGMLASGRLLITHRYMHGGKGWVGHWTQNTFAAFTDVESALARTRGDAWARIVPLDFDRSVQSDTGYTGWVQLDDGELYIVNYVLDDAPKAQIRGYTLRETDVFLDHPGLDWPR
jgi:sialidase-1